jgi:ABC-type branched-subunit amino acid transport system substrate-binding protein
MRRGQRWLVAVLAVVALAAAACGSSSSKKSTAKTTTTKAAETTTTVKLTGDPIKLMVIYEKTAGVAQPDQAKGAIAAAKAITASGGINGHPVEVIECDTKNDPNTATDCGRQAVSDKVAAVVGQFSVQSGEFMPLLVQNKIASIGLNPATAADFTSAASFPITGGAPSTFGTLPNALAELGATKIALARVDLAAAAALSGFSNKALALKSLKLVHDVAVPQGAPDMSSYVAAALDGGTDGVVIGMAGQDAINFAQALRQANPNVKIAMISTETDKTVKAMGDGATGIVQANTDVSNTKAADAGRKAMKAAGFGDIDLGLSYQAVQVFAAVAKDLPEITAAAVYDKLPTVENLDIGTLPLLQFKTPSGVGIPRIFNDCESAVQLQVTGGKVTTKPVGSGKLVDPYTGKECAIGTGG